MADPDSTTITIADLAASYAPLVVLHEDDKLRPSSADWFLARSALRWATGGGLDGVSVPEAHGKIDASRLGAASRDPYGFHGYPASALTRPLDDQPARGGLRTREQGRLAGPLRVRGRHDLLGLRRDRQVDDLLALLRGQFAAARNPSHG
jgi:hypothetical protein